ncbi:type IV pilin-like G/H family protein [Merismopedia glauca]|uniref:Uncharacterized protein n=1 Tax=Merismopedia glauca CCAP 1448/3 TaxID=1296344 RepID=A0A2T1C548_9CYAN|nr:type IV pilin-like G/H family protein [Merismopedia glauca]PSB03267.1 hypothetical protein C7B64_09220 [Merismopedia glauca CCAP 1448/3]
MYARIPLTIGAIASLICISATPSISQTLEEKLLGTWESELAFERYILVFTSPNNLFILNAAGSKSEYHGLEYRYKINRKAKPTQLDIIIDGIRSTDKLSTILEIDRNGTLKIQLEGVKPNQERPKIFTDNATTFAKISGSTSLPPKAFIYNGKPQPQTARGKESEARLLIDFINRAQIFHRSQTTIFVNNTEYPIKRTRFTNKFDALALGTLSGKSRAQTNNYAYRLFGGKDRAFATATAKVKGLKSYVGATFLYVNVEGKSVMSSIVCETEKPTKIPPKFPKLVGGSDSIKCPLGSQLLK